jgi:hypothetical protein
LFTDDAAQGDEAVLEAIEADFSMDCPIFEEID